MAYRAGKQRPIDVMSVYSPWRVRGCYVALGSSITAGPGSCRAKHVDGEVNATVRISMHHTMFLLAAAAAAIAIATAPNASAAPSEQPCSHSEESTQQATYFPVSDLPRG